MKCNKDQTKTKNGSEIPSLNICLADVADVAEHIEVPYWVVDKLSVPSFLQGRNKKCLCNKMHKQITRSNRKGSDGLRSGYSAELYVCRL